MSNLRWLAAALVSMVGCRCGPIDPTPVTLRLKNDGRDPIFVDESDGRFGLKVHRNVAGQWFPFVEEPRCSCQACAAACSFCACDAGTARLVRKVPSGAVLERTWGGYVQVDSAQSCGGAGTVACLRSEVPPLDETFRLQLCYSPSAPDFQAIDGGLVAPGVLSEKGLICVDRDFRIADGVVEVSPKKGADCTGHGDCRGQDELCFSGGCTTSCPSNSYPQVGASWQVSIAEPEDLGFFTRSTVDGRTVWTGTGSVSSVLYQNGTMQLRLSRKGPSNESLNGAVYVTLPSQYAVPLTNGQVLSVKLIDGSTSSNHGQRAIVLRGGAGELLLAAETAQLERLLREADTAPFTVTSNAVPVGCQHDECGKRLYFTTTFSGGQAPVELEPGESGQTTAAGGSYRFVNVTSYAYPSTWCRLKAMAPYAILRVQ